VKVLYLYPSFFGYQTRVRKKMETMGIEVVAYDERAVSSAFGRALLKICPLFLSKKTDIYYKKIMSKHKHEQFDYIIFSRCDAVSAQILNKIKEVFPKAKMCLYLADSIKNIPNMKKKLSVFDAICSFDREDCKNFGFNFRSLYFSDDFANKAQCKDKKYDLCFCGTIHSDRYAVLSKIEQQAKELGLNFYKFYYLQAKFMYYFYKVFGKGFKNAKMSEFAFEKKPLSELAEIEDASNVIVDIQHPAQTGLTMRTIEMIGLKKKIITTNADIKNYDFYNPANICIIDRENPVLDKAFFETPYQDIPQEVYNRYSLEQWVKDVLGMEDAIQ